MDFSNIKTTGNRAYDINLLNQINDELSYLPDKQRASVLATIIEESGGNPLAKNDTGAYHGLMQWGADRYRIKSEDVQEELKNQLAYLKETIHNTKDHRSWTHGGTGSGYKSLRDTYSDFNNSNLPMEKVYRGLSYGYVRPKGKEDSYDNRVKIAKTLYSQMPQIPDYLRTPSAFHQMRMDKIFGNKHDTGGSLKHKTWNELSMHERADIMRVAINNGITKLENIKSKYKEFSEGVLGNSQSPSTAGRYFAIGGHIYNGVNGSTQQLQLGKPFWEQQNQVPSFFEQKEEYLKQKEVENKRKLASLMQAVDTKSKDFLDKRYNNEYTLSNDNIWVESKDPMVRATKVKNPHLTERSVQGAKAHAAWEKEHPILATWGNILGAAPLAVATYPLAATAGAGIGALGDVAAATSVGQGITNFLTPIATTSYAGATVPQWLDLGLTSGFGAHGVQTAIDEKGISPMTALEVAPLGRLAKSVFNEGVNTGKVVYDELYAPWKVSSAMNKSLASNPIIKTYESNPAYKDVGTLLDYQDYIQSIFPNSKVKNIVFHTTPSKPFEVFDPNRVRRGFGFYFSPSEHKLPFNKNVYARVNMENPLEINPATNKRLSVDGLSGDVDGTRAALKEGDHDGIIGITNMRNPGEPEVVALNPEQIHILGSNRDLKGFRKVFSEDTPGMLQVKAQSYPIGQWTGSKGFVRPSEYVNPGGVDVSGSTYNWLDGYGKAKQRPNSILYRETNKKSSGGQLKHKMWNDLSLAEKDAMIAVAVKNGITDLPTIRQKYNEFAGGGTLPGREDSNNHILNAGLKVAKFLGIDKSIKGDAGDVHYRQNLYNHIDPTAPYPTSAKEAFLYFKKAQAAKSKENLPKERSTTDLVADAAWAKRLGLTYDKTQLIDNPDGSVHLPKSVEMEIPTDTAFLKNRIKANEDLLNYYRNIGGVSKDRKDVINAGLNLDRMALESLRHTYKTGEPAIINEGANISRRLIENGLVVSKPSPLNVLQNFTVKYNKDKNEMEYSDVYDFNQYEDFVPGSPFRIKGSIKLRK